MIVWKCLFWVCDGCMGWLGLGLVCCVELWVVFVLSDLSFLFGCSLLVCNVGI